MSEFEDQLDHIPMGMDRRLDSNPELARVLPMPNRQTHAVFARKGVTLTHKLPSAPGFERNMPGDDSVTCQRTLIGDSLNDEQWGTDLYNPLPL